MSSDRNASTETSGHEGAAGSALRRASDFLAILGAAAGGFGLMPFAVDRAAAAAADAVGTNTSSFHATAAIAEQPIGTRSLHQEATMTPKTSTVTQPESATSAVRPFHFRATDEALADLRRRITATKWPSGENVADDSQGVQLATMRELARYWQTDYDWRKFEAKLSALPQFVTNIDGLDIHFIHVRSKHPNALPIIVTHGWPGSIIEQLKIIEPLTNPTAYGGSASDAFDVVIPSLPGHGFSGKPTTLGWDPVRIARAWVVLMKRLGYTRFVAQGGDWGNAVTEQMALLAPPELLGIHTNMPAAVPADIAKALLAGGPPPAGLSADERHAYDQLDLFYKNGLAYAQEMSQRPQTLYAIDDSPIGLAAWMLDHDARSYELIARVFKGQKEGLTRDDILDNVTLYWLTNTGVSAARLYWETLHQVPLRQIAFFGPQGVVIPVAISAFPDELYQAPRSWIVRAYPKLIYYNRLAKGGHFAAWEQPELFTAEMRAAFKSLRTPVQK
jgi:pimeloyl-ACP methyl ester carboxylesterase